MFRDITPYHDATQLSRTCRHTYSNRGSATVFFFYWASRRRLFLVFMLWAVLLVLARVNVERGQADAHAHDRHIGMTEKR